MSTETVANETDSSPPPPEPEQTGRDKSDAKQASIVLIVSSNERLSAAISEHLSGLNVAIHRHNAGTVIQIDDLREMFPDVAFVDYAAVTADNFPLHKAVRNAIPGCQIVLLCAGDQAAEAAKLVSVWEAFDYLLTDGEPDPHRTRLLVKRAQMDTLPELSEIYGFAKRQNRRIIELLGEMKAILKTDCNNPVIKIIHEARYDSLSTDTQESLMKAGLSAEYRGCLLDFFCGKIRRLEHEISSLREDEIATERPRADTVLLVEDDVVSAELARGLLERNGFDVIVAKTAEAAFHELIRQRPSLVLMDVHLGMSDGLRIVKLMRSRSGLQDVPVIVVTSDHHRKTLFDAMGVQIQGYLLKPYQPKQLIDKVKNVMTNWTLSMASDATCPSSPGTSP